MILVITHRIKFMGQHYLFRKINFYEFFLEFDVVTATPSVCL